MDEEGVLPLGLRRLDTRPGTVELRPDSYWR